MGMVQYSSMDRRFFHRLGASILDRTLCSSAGKAGIKATLGGSVGMDPERFDEARLILLWGANPVVSNLHLWSRVQEGAPDFIATANIGCLSHLQGGARVPVRHWIELLDRMPA
jgi:anaerobic selenocysteine-containing dehydrogenase